MTRIAIVSDIHGNLPALEAVIADIVARGCHAVVNLGDCLSGPLWPEATAERLIVLAWPTIAGNHERQLLSGASGASDAFAAAELSRASWDWIAALPASLVIDGLHLCHGTPASDLDHLLFTVTDAGLRPATDAEVGTRAAGHDTPMLLCGHTHIAAQRRIGGLTVVNPGSVGLQAFGDAHPAPYTVANGDPRARYAVVEDGSVTFVEVAYDHAAAAAKAAREGFDDWAVWLATGRVSA